MTYPPLSQLRLLSACALGLALGVAARTARADDANDKAAAEALYELGHRLMDQGNYAEACPKLDASQELDPGVGTLLLLGDCDEKLGKPASAWGAFQAASALAKLRSDPDRAGLADLRASALKPRLNYVRFDVSAATAAAGLELRRGGKLVGSGAWGVSLPIDPGSYPVTASAPGHESWQSTLTIPSEPVEPIVVHVPALAESKRTALAPPKLDTPREPVTRVHESSSAQKTIGAVTVSLGIAGGIAGGVLTYLAWKKNNDSKGHCESIPTRCNVTGVAQRSDALKLARAATYVGIGSAVVLTTGVVLYLSAPSPGSHGEAAYGFSLSSTF